MAGIRGSMYASASDLTYLKVPAELSTFFTPDEVRTFRYNFSLFDANQDGHIDVGELEAVLHELGDVGSAEKLIGQVDKDGDGMVSFAEFVQMMHASRTGGGDATSSPSSTFITTQYSHGDYGGFDDVSTAGGVYNCLSCRRFNHPAVVDGLGGPL